MTPEYTTLLEKTTKALERLETLKVKHTDLRIKFETEKNAVDQVLGEAIAEYGVSTLEEIEATYEKNLQENMTEMMRIIKEVDEYEKALNELDKALEAIK